MLSGGLSRYLSRSRSSRSIGLKSGSGLRSAEVLRGRTMCQGPELLISTSVVWS